MGSRLRSFDAARCDWASGNMSSMLEDLAYTDEGSTATGLATCEGQGCEGCGDFPLDWRAQARQKEAKGGRLSHCMVRGVCYDQT